MNQSSIFPSRRHRDNLVAKLKELGIEQIVVSFSGSGDSGSITGIDAMPVPEGVKSWEYGHNILRQHTIAWAKSWSTFENDSWVRHIQDQETSLHSALENVAYQALDVSGIDWYNDDGGQGEFSMNIIDGQVEINLEVGVNYTQTNEHRFEVGNDWPHIERLPLP